MTCTEEYREHIEYTFHAFCKVVIRNATINAARTRSRKHKREISLEYLTDEKHYPLGTTDEYFQAPEPDEEYILTLCGDTVIFSSGLLAEALSRLDEREREMIYLSFFKRIPQHEIGRQYGRSRSTAGYHIRKALRQLKRKWREWHMRNNRLLPYETIVQAASGEPEAVGTVLQYYRRRIQCAARVNGRVDQDTEDYITQTLLTAIFKFRFGR